MNKLLLLICFSGYVTLLSAQQVKHSVLYNVVNEKINTGEKFTALSIFSPLKTGTTDSSTILRHFAKLAPDKNILLNTFRTNPELISIAIPFGKKQYMLKLSRQHINSSGDFSFGVIENGVRKKTSGDEGLHYRGYIGDDPSSLACISIFENGEVMCLFSNSEGNFNLGRSNDGKNDYVIYKDNDIINPPRSGCGFEELPENAKILAQPAFSIPPAANAPLTAPALLCNKVRVYWEADNSLYATNFSSNITSLKNYITGVFNEVAALYQNEGIQLELSESFVWTTPDPYSRASSASAITSFRSHWNTLGDSFNGDLAHLVTGSPGNNGGVAYLLPSACEKLYGYGYDNVFGNYKSYPAYSWDVYLLAHETGHNLGSYHTQWCGWKTGPGGSCGSIDNCYTQENYDTCAACFTTTNIASPPAQFKGTIMSYCHLVSGIGTDLANGFGPLPQAVIRNNVTNSACFRQGSSWTGAVSTAWENPGNWSCGLVPTATTDVIIGPGLPNYPEINSTADVCHSITISGNATLTLKPGFKLNVTGSSQ